MINSYSPTWPEWLLGLGGVAVVGLIVAVALKLLGFLPENLADQVTDTSGLAPSTTPS